MNLKNEIWYELRSINTDKKELVKFGFIVGGIFLLLGYFRPVFLWIGGVLVLGALFLPSLLKYPYRIWMSFAVVMGFFMFRVLLVIIYYVAILPIGMIARLVGYDPMGRRKEAKTLSYWISYKPGGSPNDSY